MIKLPFILTSGVECILHYSQAGRDCTIVSERRAWFPDELEVEDLARLVKVLKLVRPLCALITPKREEVNYEWQLLPERRGR